MLIPYSTHTNNIFASATACCGCNALAEARWEVAWLAKKKKAAGRPTQPPSSSPRQDGRRPTGHGAGTARPPQQPGAPAQPPQTNRHGMQRASGGVPPADAFDNLKRRPPPNLPGPGREPEAPVASPSTQKGTRGKTVRMPAPAPTQPPKARKKPKRPVNPAKRRRRRRLAAVLALLVVVGIGVWLSLTLLFKIESFELKGDTRYTLEEVSNVFAFEPGESMFSFSAGNAQKRIEAQLPYVETAKVRRKLPSTIIFEVTEATEAYCLPWEDGTAIVSSKLKVLRTTDTAPDGLMRIEGLSWLQVTPGQPLALQEAAYTLDASTASSASKAASQSASDTSLPASSQAASDTSTSQTEDPEQGTDTPTSTPPGAGAAGDDTQGTEDSTGDDTGAGTDDPDASDSTASTPVSSAPPPAPEPDPPALSTDPVASFEAMELLLETLAADGLEDVNVLNVADPLNLRIVWQGRITVELGPKSGMEEKLAAAQVLLAGGQGLIGERDKGTLDMRYYLSTGQSYFKPS